MTANWFEAEDIRESWRGWKREKDVRDVFVRCDVLHGGGGGSRLGMIQEFLSWD